MRILLAGMTNMLSQIVSAVLAQSTQTVLVGRVEVDGEIAASIRSTQADVVMLQTADPENSHAISPLLYDFPRLRVVTIARSGQNGFIHELRPYVRPLVELSADALLVALHSDYVGVPR